MSYTEVFGGATLYPSDQTYLSISFSTNITLAWPVEQQIGGNVVADILDLDATATGLNVDLPDARQVSNGIQSVFVNIGANTFTVRSNDGSTIISVNPGNAWVAYLTDNSTIGGTWRTFQLGATVSVASAAALGGAGIKPIGTTLNQSVPPDTRTTTPVTVADSDRASLVIYTGGVGIADLPTPGTVGADWFFLIRNAGSGNLTLTPPSGQIDGAVNLALVPGSSAIVITDGTDFFTVGLGQATTGTFDFVEIAVPGSGNFTLSGVNLNRIAYRFTGILTGNRNIIVPNTTQEYWVDNSTTGAFTLSVQTAAQVTPVEVAQNNRAILYCDGTNVINANTNTVVTFPIGIAQGGTGATDAATAVSNLGAVPTSRQVTGSDGISNGGALTGDVNFTFDIPNMVLETPVATDDAPFNSASAAGPRRASLLNRAKAVAPRGVLSANVTVPTVSSVTLFTLPVLANTRYRIQIFLLYSSLNDELRLRFTNPAGTTANLLFKLYNVAAPNQTFAFGSLITAYDLTTTEGGAEFVGTVDVSATPGNLVLTVEKVTDTGADGFVLENTSMIAEIVS